MALINKLEEIKMDNNRVHEEIGGTYSIFQDGANVYLQIDTYGSKARKTPGKKSQTIQFGPNGIQALRKILLSL